MEPYSNPKSQSGNGQISGKTQSIRLPSYASVRLLRRLVCSPPGSHYSLARQIKTLLGMSLTDVLYNITSYIVASLLLLTLIDRFTSVQCPPTPPTTSMTKDSCYTRQLLGGEGLVGSVRRPELQDGSRLLVSRLYEVRLGVDLQPWYHIIWDYWER